MSRRTLLRGAVTEAELLLGEFAMDDAVILTIARDPDRFEDVIRALCLPMGWVDVKVCAVDEVWSGLKLVIRLSERG